MKDKTIKGIRTSANTLFVAVASAEGDHALRAFNDVENSVIFVAQANEKGHAYSPIDGKRAVALSVGEIATSSEDLGGYTSIGKCKCGCNMLTDASIAKMLVTAGEDSIYCTACGKKMDVAMEDEEEPSEDEDMSDDDEDVSMEDEEDMSDDDDSSDDEVDDEEIAALVAEVAAMEEEEEEPSEEEDEDVSMEDEEDTSDDEDEDVDVDEEVARLIAEVAAEDDSEDDEMSDDDSEEEVTDEDLDVSDDEEDTSEDEASDTVVAHSLHKLVAGKDGKTRILFVDGETAMLQHIDTAGVALHIGNFMKKNASPESAGLYGRREAFGAVTAKLIEAGALAEETPSEDISKLGFQPIKVEMPLTVAQETVVKEAVEAASVKATEEAAAKLNDVSQNYAKLVTLAAVGLDKGAIEGASLYKEIASLIASLGVRNADVVASKFCETKVKPFLSAVIEKANELSKKDAGYVSGMSDTIAKASYASLNTDATPQISTAVHVGQDTEIASIDDAREIRQNQKPDLRNALARLGGRRG